MLVFYVKDNDVKDFMNKLFFEEVFDKFEVRNIFIETIVKYEILCNINKEYLLDEDCNRYFTTWKEIKGYIFQIIKGSKKPKFMKIIFSLDDIGVGKLFNNCSAMFLNILYENDLITCTTGTSQKNFSLDKTCDIVWENTVLKFIEKNSIVIEKED